MSPQIKVTGVILAGGLARRMNNQDKGLVFFKDKPMVTYALDVMQSVVDDVLINANRNLESYRQLGYPVITDQNKNFEGPLAGIFSAMSHVESEILLVMPCDSPLIKAKHLNRLLSQLQQTDVDVAVAFDGERLHPVFLAIKTCLKSSLEQYLAGGNRKIDIWLKQHRMIEVDFSSEPEVFKNINTMTELSTLESKSHG